MKLPYHVSRTLKRYASKHGRQVMIRVRMTGGKDFEIPVYDHINSKKFPISIKEENWYNGTAMGGDYHISIDNINLLIDEIEKKIRSVLFILQHRKIEITRSKILHLSYSGPEQFKNDLHRKEADDLISKYHQGKFASEKEFFNFISNTDDSKYKDLKRDLGMYEKNYILDYWDDFIASHAQATYNHSKKAIITYINESGDDCIVTRYDENWLNRFFGYLIVHGYYRGKDDTQRIPYGTSTLVKYLRHMRSFGDYLFEQKVITNQNYRRYKLEGK
jgi:hypothetical protein